MSEANVLAAIRAYFKRRKDVKLFRMQSGNFLLKDGRRITVGAIGMSDLIGYRSITVTPEMVGTTVAVFCAVEVKAPGARTDPSRLAEQQAFVEAVEAAGGLGGFATSTEEAIAVVVKP